MISGNFLTILILYNQIFPILLDKAIVGEWVVISAILPVRLRTGVSDDD